MRALPVPVCGGEIDRLWNFINLQDTDRLMFLAWMLEALRPDTPYLIMELVGEQGSAKSSSQRCVLQLLNPTQVPLKAAPKQREDIFVAARNNAVVSFENLSSLSVEFQDALCTLATGGGFSTRLFFTNDEEAILEVKRPVILNGISQVITRQDLLDRALTFSLPTVDGKRRTEQELGAEFNDLLPKLLGGLLDLFVAVLATLPQVRIPQAELPRMADFALLGEALYQVQGKSQGAFLSEYLERRVDAVQRTIESSPVALVAIEWLKEHRKGYRGTVKGLFIALNSMMFDIERGEYWPKTPKGFADAFRRVAPSLRILGIDAQFLPKRQRDGYHCILVRNADAPQVPAETRGKEVHDIHPGTQAVDEIQDIQVEA